MIYVKIDKMGGKVVFISIIMPVYNVEEHLHRALQSVLTQSSQAWELILVDDGSTDQSGRLCDQFQAQYQDQMIHVIHQENLGSGMARNAGFAQAQGEYIYFADPDDYLESTLIEDNRAQLLKEPTDLFVFGYEVAVAGSPNMNEVRLPAFPNLTTTEMVRDHFGNYYYNSPYALWNKLYKREFLAEIGAQFTDQVVGQDALFNLDVLAEVSSIGVNRQVYYHYVKHPGSAIRRFRAQRFELESRIAQKLDCLIDSWGMSERFCPLIQEAYWQAVYLEVVNLSHSDCPLSVGEQAQRLQAVMAQEQVSRYVDRSFAAQETNVFRRQLMRALLAGHYRWALRLMKGRLAVERWSADIFYTVRQWLS